MQTVTGFIRTSERIPNTHRRFGAATEYVVAYLVQAGQEPQPLLFTVDELRDARERAKANPEDCPPFEAESQRTAAAVQTAVLAERARIAQAVEAALLAERERVGSQAKYQRSHDRFLLGAMAFLSLGLGAGIGALL